MTFRTWIKKLFGLSSQFPVRRASHQHQRPFAPLLEPLEDRLAPANLVVINTNDTGAGSLRGQIAAASAGDTISFAPSLDGQTITLSATSGPLTIAKNLTILGLGADQLTVSGGNVTGDFSITAGVVTISGLRVTGGQALFGGGIDVTGGTANLIDLDVEANATANFGGGVRVDTANLNVTGSTIANNHSAYYGAGIEANDAQVTVTNSTIANNTTGIGSSQSQGASGIAVFGNATSPSNLQLESSTLSGNVVASATQAADISVQSNDGSTQTITLHNTILNGAAANPSGTLNALTFFPGAIITSLGHNISSDDSGNLTQSSDMPGTNPLLGTLGSNGGATPTINLLVNSPALNNGDPTGGAPTLDQRGAIRGAATGVGATANAGNAPDIGAYEDSSLYVVTSSDSTTTPAAYDTSTVGSLRGGVEWANANANVLVPATTPNLVTFDTTSTFATPQTITLQLGALMLTGATVPESIAGPGVTGPSALTVSGNNLSQVIYNSFSTTSTISGMTLTRGNNIASMTESGYGGAVYDGGTLTLDNVSITNSVASQKGGGVFVQEGGTATLQNSTVSGNTAVDGAGLYSLDGALTLQSSTISGNDATGGVGGVFAYTGSLTVQDSTIANNTSSDSSSLIGGGGVGLNGAAATIENSTIAFNTAQKGSGIEVGNSSTLTLQNTIVAGNTVSGAAGDLGNAGGLINADHDLIQATPAAGIINGMNTGNLTGVNPNLGTLANNGGPTQTLALMAPSPAIDAGNNSGAPAFDQRGFTRIVNGTIDIGAFEDQLVATPPTSPQSALAGASSNFNLGSITDSAPGANTFTATIHWGDGSANQVVTFVRPVGVLINTATETGNTVTISTAGAHGLAVGDVVTVSGVGVAGYNGTFTVTSVPNATTFTYTISVIGLPPSGSGAVTANTLALPITAHTFAAESSTSGYQVTVTVADTLANNGQTTFTVNTAPTLSPATLPADTINLAYNQTITASGGTAINTLSVTNIANAIPGLTVPTAGGTGSITISGTPTATGTETFTVTVTDQAGGTTSTNYSITVNPTPTLSPATLPADTINLAYHQTVTASGGTGTLSLAVTNIANAIPGLTVPASGTGSITISGTPTATGTETFTVTATDSLGATTFTNYSITVNPTPTLSPATLPADTINLAYHQTVTASGGTGTLSLAVTNITNAIPGLTVPAGGTGSIAISGTPTATGTESFTVTVTDSLGATTFTNYSITVNPTPTLSPATLPADTINLAYHQTVTASGGTGTLSLAVTNIANAIPGLTVPASGTGSITINGTPTATGTETFTVTVTDAVGATSFTNYSITVNPAVTLSPATLPADTVNIAYNQTITASGGTGTLSLAVSNITNAIPGLTVPASGTGSITISGTPTTTGTETFTVTATDSLGATTFTNYSITVNPAVTLSPATLPADTINVAYHQTITANGGSFYTMLTVSNITNPIAGLTVPNSGMGSITISGTPTATGTETFTVTATDYLGGTTSTNYSITVNPAPTLSPATLPGGTVNSAYNQTIAGSGGTGTLTLVVSNIQNPVAGLNVPSSGTGSITINGTPTTNGTETFTVTVTDSLGSSQQTTYSVTVIKPNVVAKGGFSFSLVEGSATINGPVATFTDPGNPTGANAVPSDYSATINWGDGTSSTAAITRNGGLFLVNGFHIYAGTDFANAPGVALNITTVIDHDQTTPQTATSSVTITDPPVVASGGLNFAGTRDSIGANFPNTGVVATFIDPGNPLGDMANPSDYSATIDWGDGTSSTAAITRNGGLFIVNGSHAYFTAGTFPITVTINHDQTTPQVVTSVATVSEPAVIAQGGTTIMGIANLSLDNVQVATFTDPGGLEFDPEVPASINNYYTASIDWGDGTAATAGTIVALSNTTAAVYGSHTYTSSAPFTVTVAINRTPSSAGTTVQPGDDHFVGLLFQDFLGRNATQQEINFWAQQIPVIGRAQVIYDIEHSTAAMQRVVVELFQQILDRSPGSDGLAYFVPGLMNGETIEEAIATMTTATGEFRALANANPLFTTQTSDAKFVLELYQELLNRPSTTVATSELNYWLGVMHTYGPGTMVLQFTQWQQFRQEAVQTLYGYPSQVPSPLLVQSPFELFLPDLLHRTAEPAAADITYWVNTPFDLLAMEASIAGSAEYYNRS